MGNQCHIDGCGCDNADCPPPLEGPEQVQRIGGRKGNRKTRPNGAVGFSVSQLVFHQEGDIRQLYHLDDTVIGVGRYGTVSRAVHKVSHATFAVKAIVTPDVAHSSRCLVREIQIMKELDHPNILKLYETYEDETHMHLVVELCEGGDLFGRIVDHGHFLETHAAIVMRQVFRAVNYMHENRVCHRDLKHDNFMFATRGPIETNMLKVIDFGHASRFVHGTPMTSRVGVLYSSAPEVFQLQYDNAIDLWSCGVLMYAILCGYLPFDGEKQTDILLKVTQGEYWFYPDSWDSVSEDAKKLIGDLLLLNPRERCTASEALQHRWVQGFVPAGPPVYFQPSFIANLRSLRHHNRLKRAALFVIARQLRPELVTPYVETFQTLDRNGKGGITHAELLAAMKNVGIKKPPDITRIMEELDANGNGMIDYTEFVAATLDKNTQLREDVLWAAFGALDRNGDGRISMDDLHQVLSNGLEESVSASVVAEVMLSVDTNRDGYIDFEEFSFLMQGQRSDIASAITDSSRNM
eukprot:NODE_183_length_1850_cov_362.410028.p1 GENE.NODE_183_length_1850_cov_362.410028~~NODE_183_length_1850_cov_362.410028.p1  ORF type:complete len:522 (-),score=158.92 NODE_183_length_1850_cov_362.410028:106-1671(-)